MDKFKVGDRVITKRSRDFYEEGEKGTITYISSAGTVEVSFDSTNPSRFDGGKTCRVAQCNLDLLPESTRKVVITVDGNKTVAREYEGKKVVKTGIAKCNPKDEFSFKTGAELAFTRLMSDDNTEPEKPKLYNGRVVVTETAYPNIFTVGKIYTFTDGNTKCDLGTDIPSCPAKSFDEICRRILNTKFIEIKEE